MSCGSVIPIPTSVPARGSCLAGVMPDFSPRAGIRPRPEGSLLLVYTGGTAGVAGRKPGDAFDLTVLQIIDDREGGVPGAAPTVRVLETPHALPLVLNGVKAYDSDADTPDKVQVGAAPTGGALKVRELDFAAVPNRFVDATDVDDDDILDNFRVLNPDGTENKNFHVRYDSATRKFFLYHSKFATPARRDVGAEDGFTGQLLVDRDGAGGGESFAYDAGVWNGQHTRRLMAQ